MEVTVDEQAGTPDAGGNGCKAVLVSKKVGVIAIKLSVTVTIPLGIPFPAVTSVPTESAKLPLFTFAGSSQVAVGGKEGTVVLKLALQPPAAGVPVIPAGAGITLSEPPGTWVTDPVQAAGIVL